MTGRVGRSSFYCFDTVRQTDAKILAGRSIGTTMATTTTMTTTPRTTTTTTLMTTINHDKVNVLSPLLHVNLICSGEGCALTRPNHQFEALSDKPLPSQG